MKKNYEKFSLITFIVFIFIFIEFVIISTFYSKKYRDYKVLNMIVVTSNYTKAYLDTKNYDLIKSNKYLYVDNKRLRYEIIDVNRNILKQNKKWYHEVLFKIKLPKKYKDNDTVIISIYSHKEFLFNIFKKCWEDGT